MTACGFHDLVGQRVTKITETLDKVIATRMNAEAGKGKKRAVPPAKARGKSKLTLEGPGIPGASDAQERVDALFRDN
jgi:hypothetical protein